MKRCRFFLISAAMLFVLSIFLCCTRFPGEAISDKTVTTGLVDRFYIGESKQALLARLPHEWYSPEPKPRECQGNWMAADSANKAERNCLLSSNQWQVGDGIPRLCPTRTDFFATLFFSANKVSSVRIVCTVPE